MDVSISLNSGYKGAPNKCARPPLPLHILCIGAEEEGGWEENKWKISCHKFSPGQIGSQHSHHIRNVSLRGRGGFTKKVLET